MPNNWPLAYRSKWLADDPVTTKLTLTTYVLSPVQSPVATTRSWISQLTLQTGAKKWVYGQISSDNPWLKVTTPQVSGPQHAAIAFEIDTNLFFSNVVIETSGGSEPVRCHGHRKRDAIEMKQLIDKHQSDYYGKHV